ncbi:unnamed protein product, partial [Nesidiocoris tenuis]
STFIHAIVFHLYIHRAIWPSQGYESLRKPLFTFGILECVWAFEASERCIPIMLLERCGMDGSRVEPRAEDSNRMRKREKGEKRGKTRSFRQENVMYQLYREQSSRLRSAGEDDIKLGRLGD